jgi:hypothetical protein
MQFLRRHLSVGGRAVIVYPNPGALGAQYWAEAWVGWDPPRHLSLPAGDGVEILAKDHGLTLQLGTRGRSAKPWMSASRKNKSGKPGGLPSTAIDRLLAWTEGVLLVLGFPVGEEIVAVLTRADSPIDE